MRARFENENGAVALMVAFLMVVLVGAAAMTFDLSRLRHERHLIQAAVDLGSLAGAGLLPVSNSASATIAESTARAVAVRNASELGSSGLTITFACVVSDPEGNGGFDSLELRFACGPAGGSSAWSGGWTSRGGKAIHDCNPYGGDLCNTIKLSASSIVEYWFAPIMGLDEGNTGAVRAAACRGFCGQASSPLDMVFVIDRSRSMTATDMANLKDAIVDTSVAEDSVLEFYNPADVHVGIVELPYKLDRCRADPQQFYPRPVPPNMASWQVVGLSSDYRGQNGLLNTNSALVNAVQCLQQAPSNTTVIINGRQNNAGHTNHGDPLRAAQAILNLGRADVPNVIVFFADGESNQPDGVTQPCAYAISATSAAKAAGTTVFSLGYGAVGARCQRDTSGLYRNAWASKFLADAASRTATGASTDNLPGGCAADENTDGDYYFCESRGEDLDNVFRLIAIQTIQRSRLLNF